MGCLEREVARGARNGAVPFIHRHRVPGAPMKRSPTTTTCPRDHSVLRVEKRPVVVAGVDLGRFEVWVCPSCQRVFDPLARSLAIDAAAKAKGVFGSETAHLARITLPSKSPRAQA